MQIYNVSEKAREKGEYILGSAELHTHACYMVFGILGPGEKDREIKPGSGHEEICCLVNGIVSICRGDDCFEVGPGQAFHLKGDETWMMHNAGTADALYIISGGHSAPHEHR